jgi:hypothetical protein
MIGRDSTPFSMLRVTVLHTNSIIRPHDGGRASWEKRLLIPCALPVFFSSSSSLLSLLLVTDTNTPTTTTQTQPSADQPSSEIARTSLASKQTTSFTRYIHSLSYLIIIENSPEKSAEMPAITGRSSSRPRRVEITTPFYARSPVMGPPSTTSSGERHRPSTPHTPTRSAAMPYSPDGNTPSPTAVINRMQQRPVTPSPRRFSTPRRQTYSGTPDRFIPANLSPYSFRMGSPVENLSPDERLLRRHVHGSGSRDRSSSPSRPHQGRARANTSSPLNNRLSAGTVGVFGLGVMPTIGTIDHNPPPTRQRGREVNGGIFADTKDPRKEAHEHQFRLSAALGVDRSRKVFSFNGPQSPMHPLLPGSPGPSPFPEKRMWEYVSGMYWFLGCVMS